MKDARYLVVEGPIAVGKSSLVSKMAESLQATAVLEEQDPNPYLDKFLKDRRGYAFQTQLSFLASRFKQLQKLSQINLFYNPVIGDFMFERDRIFARLNLNEEEFALYDQFFNILFQRRPRPDMVIYLSSRTENLWRHLKSRLHDDHWYTYDYLHELNEEYNRFFFRYSETPLLVVNASDVDLVRDEDNYQHFLRVVAGHKKGVKHYIPLGGSALGQ